MKRILLASAACLYAGPALADGDVFVITQADKDMIVLENIDIAKFVFADALVSIDADKFAESYSLVNQNNFGNRACSNCAEKQDYISDSFNNNSGQMSVNQASGNMNNQGSSVAVAYDVSPGTVPPEPPNGSGEPGTRLPGGFAEAASSVDQRNGITFLIGDNDTTTPGIGATNPETVNPDSLPGDLNNGDPTIGDVQDVFAEGFDLENSSSFSFIPGLRDQDEIGTSSFASSNLVATKNIIFRNAIADDSFSDNSGVINGNQSAGNMNNQANSLSIAVSLETNGVALSEADLGQYTVLSDVLESDSGEDFGDDAQPGIRKLARIGGDSGSFNNNSGIIGFNQSAGNLANQANVVALATVGVPNTTGTN